MVLCIGELLIDFVCTDSGTHLKNGENFLKKVGGAPLNASVAIQKLGGSACMCGAVGKDPFGQILVETLDNYNVDTSNVLIKEDKNTTLAFVSLTSDGERDFNFVRGADEKFNFSDISEKTKNDCDIFHFGSATAFLGGDLEKCYYDALKFAKENNKIVSFDPNYRESLFGDKKDIFVKNSIEFIKSSDIVKVSDEEATLITNESDMNLAISKMLNLGAKYVLITLGKEGTMIGNIEGTVLIPTEPVEMVDATGAGDAFIGAMLSKILQNNCNITFENMKVFVEFANKVGAKTVTAYGALSAIPSIEEMNV